MLTANEATPGSISNMVSEALKSANSYTDNAKKEAIDASIAPTIMPSRVRCMGCNSIPFSLANTSVLW